MKVKNISIAKTRFEKWLESINAKIIGDSCWYIKKELFALECYNIEFEHELAKPIIVQYWADDGTFTMYKSRIVNG